MTSEELHSYLGAVVQALVNDGVPASVVTSNRRTAVLVLTVSRRLVDDRRLRLHWHSTDGWRIELGTGSNHEEVPLRLPVMAHPDDLTGTIAALSSDGLAELPCRPRQWAGARRL